MEQHMKKIIRKTITKICIPFAYCFCSICFGLSFLGTKNYILDSFAYSINDYNRSIHTESFKNPILSIKKKESKIQEDNSVFFNDLYNEFYYNFLVSSTRQFVDEKTTCFSDNVPIKLHTQYTMSIRTTEESSGGYYIDNGLFYSYYSDDILGERGYLKARFGCDTFIYISDTFADKLLEKYGANSYEEIILNKDYAVLPITVNENVILASINNVIYSSKRTAPRCQELYGDFGLIDLKSSIIQKGLSLKFEIDLETSPFNIKSNLNTIEFYKYNPDNSYFDFKTFDSKKETYFSNERLNKKFNAIYNKHYTEWLPVIVGILISACYLAILIIYKLKSVFPKIEASYIMQLCFLMGVFITYSFVVNFIYCYPLFSVFPIIGLLAYLIVYYKEVLNEFNSKFVARRKRIACSEFKTIEI